MELNKQIKKYRTSLNLSQDDLADKIYVTRQTISNWETGKNYPDIHSLLLMSSVFNVTLDQLTKGDIEIMREEIKKEDIKTLSIYSNVFGILMFLTIVSTAPLVLYWKIPGTVVAVVLWIVTLLFSFKVEKFKKQNNIQTYQEIVAFMNGERLDEIAEGKEKAKKPYQQFLLMVVAALITAVILVIIFKALSMLN